MKYVYNYDKETKEYLVESDADLDPAESELQGEDVYLLPAHATFIEPPIAIDGKIAVFKAGKWSMRSDNRGTTYYKSDGTATTITKVGKRIPEDCILNGPPEDLQIPNWNGTHWIEGGLVFHGRLIKAKKNGKGRIKQIVKQAIYDLGEDKAKTLKLIAGDGPCPEWDEFLAGRQELIDAEEQYIIDNELN